MYPNRSLEMYVWGCVDALGFGVPVPYAEFRRIGEEPCEEFKQSELMRLTGATNTRNEKFHVLYMYGGTYVT